MPVTVDFTVSADKLNWVSPDSLTVLVAGKRYRTPTKFYENTLNVMVNGLAVARDNVDGFIVIDDQTFEMKQTLTRTNMWIMVGYVEKDS